MSKPERLSEDFPLTRGRLPPELVRPLDDKAELARYRQVYPEMQAELAAKDAEIARLREALKPFAEACKSIGRLPDSEYVYEMADFTAGEIRAAAKALGE